MRVLRKVALASTSLVALASASLAADLPVKAGPAAIPYVSGWQGVYVGAFAGWHQTRTTWDSDETDPASALGPISFSKSGFSGGGLIGANIQYGNWVFGPEMDIGYVGGTATLDTAAFTPTDVDLIDVKQNWDAHFRARFGYSFGSWMPFLAAGIAATQAEFTLTTAGATPSPEARTDYLLGATIGGGIDFKFAPNWIARAEYLYDAYQSVGYGSAQQLDSEYFRLRNQTARGAIIYKFGN